jgi:two-component system CheB/CheR fusion protein
MESRKKTPAKSSISPANKKEESSIVRTPISQHNRNFPIVVIGSSAGGLEAFLALLKNLPSNTGMAFVFVSHQDPSHPSNLTNLLSKATSMPTTLVRDRMLIEPNHVYVIPPDRDMTITAGYLRLSRRLTGRVHMPIDSFFTSLADYKKNQAIGVVLSGTATDGTLGLTAIKAANGVTFAQDSASAKYSGMPRHAIESHVVDIVLPPEKIANELANIAKHPLLADVKKEQPETTSQIPSAMTQIFEMLKKTTGVDFTHYKPSTVMRRINRRMLLHKKESLEGYASFLKKNPGSVEALYEDILINVTSFFRDPEIFDTLKNTILRKLIKTPYSGEQILRIWVPGCSSGEEPYSIAMIIQEFLSENQVGKVNVQVFATDVSERAIEHARAGFYPSAIANDVSPERLRRFFTKNENGYQIQKLIRDSCVFARHNVTKDPPFSKIDLISCRNLLIYLGPILQRKVMPIFHYALNPHGYLILGSSESIGGFADYFFPADKKFKIYSKKLVASKLRFDQVEPFSHDRIVAGQAETQRIPFNDKDILREGDKLLLSRFVPASVVINQDFNILQFRGKTAPFLEPASGEASLNIMKMAKEGVSGVLREVLLKAKKTGAPVEKKKIPVVVDGQQRLFNLEVTPFTVIQSQEYFYLVLFELITIAEGTKKAVSRRSQQTDIDANRLRVELNATKDYLQSIIEEHEATNEELRAANEEILSSNEELQSTNEEMETAKEELQSANEELTTVNEELQVRNLELTDLNNDLTNFLASMNIAIVMLGRNLRIRKFTPMAERVLNLIPTDVGRPVTDINLNIVIPDLSSQIMEVIDTMSIKELETQDKSGHWYHVQIRPYKTMDNKIDGAVLVFLDIDELKRNLGETLSRTYLQTVVEIIAEPFVAVNESFHVELVNDAFLQKFNIRRMNLEGDLFFDVMPKEWNLAELRTLLQEMISNGTRAASVNIRHKKSKREATVHVRRLLHRENDYILLLSMQKV